MKTPALEIEQEAGLPPKPPPPFHNRVSIEITIPAHQVAPRPNTRERAGGRHSKYARKKRRRREIRAPGRMVSDRRLHTALNRKSVPAQTHRNPNQTEHPTHHHHHHTVHNLRAPYKDYHHHHHRTRPSRAPSPLHPYKSPLLLSARPRPRPALSLSHPPSYQFSIVSDAPRDSALPPAAALLARIPHLSKAAATGRRSGHPESGAVV